MIIHKFQAENTTYLQGIGHCEGIPAGQLKVGDVTVWNNGGLEKVLSIEISKSGKTMKCQMEYEWLGKTHIAERKMTTNRNN